MSHPRMMEVKDVEKMCHCLRALKKFMKESKFGLTFDDEVITPKEVQRIINFFHVEDREEVKASIKQ